MQLHLCGPLHLVRSMTTLRPTEFCVAPSLMAERAQERQTQVSATAWFRDRALTPAYVHPRRGPPCPPSRLRAITRLYMAVRASTQPPRLPRTVLIVADTSHLVPTSALRPHPALVVVPSVGARRTAVAQSEPAAGAATPAQVQVGAGAITEVESERFDVTFWLPCLSGPSQAMDGETGEAIGERRRMVQVSRLSKGAWGRAEDLLLVSPAQLECKPLQISAIASTDSASARICAPTPARLNAAAIASNENLAALRLFPNVFRFWANACLRNR